MNTEPTRALILSGGGGRGAYHVGVYELLEDIGWHPDILVGTSIGAINAAAIASGRTADELKALWLNLNTDRVQRFRVDIFDIEKWTYLLDNSPWRRSLNEDQWFDFDRINSDEAPLLAIAATDVRTGRPVIFANRPLDEGSPLPRGKQVRVVRIGLEHIMASCSIPIVYPWTTLPDEGAYFWDGAVVSNTPLGTALRAGATQIIVVLLAPWEESPFSAEALERKLRLWSLPGLALDWALLASFRADLKLCEAINLFVTAYQELTPEQRERLVHKLWGHLSPDEQQRRAARLARYRTIEEPYIVAPREPFPIEYILTYDPDNHRELFRQGYEDAVRELRALIPPDER